MRRLWTEPVVDFNGKWVKCETARLDPKPIQKPHVPIIVGGYADAAFARAVKFGAGWYGFNLDPSRTKHMLGKLDAAFAKAGRTREAGYQIIVTPPMNMAPDEVKEYAALVAKKRGVKEKAWKEFHDALLEGRAALRRDRFTTPGHSCARSSG